MIKEQYESKKQAMTSAMEHVLDTYMPGWRDDPSTDNTAERFVKYLLEYQTPLDLHKIFGSQFDLHPDQKTSQEETGMVVQTNIPFQMICEHHLLPARGRASIGYVPTQKVIGLSKLARLVKGVGLERPSLQERIGERIANLMVEHLKPSGVAVVIGSEHTCMSCRGVTTPDVVTVTSALRGVFYTNPQARAELLALIKH